MRIKRVHLIASLVAAILFLVVPAATGIASAESQNGQTTDLFDPH